MILGNAGLSTSIAFHCMTPSNNILYINPKIDTVCYSIAADICILKVPAELGRSKINISNMSETMVGDTLYCAGFTGAVDLQNVTICNIKDLSYSSATTPVNSILVDSVTMMGGNSGGPWINTRGELVGIGSWGYSTRLPNHTHDIEGNVEGSVLIDNYSDSFDIFGVSAKSLLKLINKYVEAGFPNTPFNYKGMGIPSNNNNELATLEIQSLRFNVEYERWHKSVSGCYLTEAVGSIPIYSIVHKIEINGLYKTIGCLNSQYKDYDLDVFYGNPQVGLNVKWLQGSDSNIVTSTLPLRERKDSENDLFISLSMNYKNKMIRKLKKSLYKKTPIQ